MRALGVHMIDNYEDGPVPPGWYRDPDHPHTEMYWDGRAWVTDLTRPVASDGRVSEDGF